VPAEPLLGERRGRTQFAGAERGQRPTGFADRLLGARKTFGERHGPMKAHAHDLETGLRRYAARILKNRRDGAITACRKHRCHVPRPLDFATLRQCGAIDKPALRSAHLKQ